MHREAIKEASTMSIHQDAAQGCIIVRFMVCGPTLAPYAGMLGYCNLAKHYGLDACAIKSGTLRILQEACTPMLRPPFGTSGTLDTSLYEKTKQIIELWDTDAAEDEVLAGKMLQGKRGVAALAAVGAADRVVEVLPNLKVRNRDKPHGTRRIATRTWKADEFLESINQTIVVKKNSIMNVIRYSDLFKHRFAKCAKQLETNPATATTISDISSAKHRFESMSKPFGRGCIYWQALVVTAQTILDERGKASKSGGAAMEFLQFISVEVMVCFAMMADATDEIITLVRFVEAEDYDKSKLASQLDSFVHRLQILFVHGQVVNTGYTAHMLHILRSPLTVYLPDARGVHTKVIGGKGCPSEALLQQCLRRFRNFVTLAVGVVRAEFPNFEVLQTFSIFHLGNRVTQNNDADYERLLGQTQTEHAKALCACLQLDVASFNAQLVDHRSLAEKIFLSKKITVLDAWWTLAIGGFRGRSSVSGPCARLRCMALSVPIFVSHGRSPLSGNRPRHPP